MNPDSATKFLERRGAALICLLLGGCTIAVFWQLRTCEFINLDDPFIIYKNPIVAQGWTMQGFMWSLTTSYFEYWHPLTWWSHMTDCELFGLAAHWHHLISLGFHVLNTLVLFAAFRELTGKMMRSAIVAALFALHPMHVESVAWLAERKDVLSTFFWAASLWGYARYVKLSQTKSNLSEFYYRVSLFAYLGGLMSKPMVLTLPFVLLLLDYWPLNRFEGRGNFPATLIYLAREKLAFFAFMLLSCFLTYSNVKAAHNIISAETVPWSLRLANVPVSYARYLAKLVWPTRMTLFYPLPDHWALWQVAISAIGILVISAVVIWKARQAPYLVVGWCMFLGTLVPTLSIVAVGYQSLADRYTYLSYTGLFVAMVWAVGDLSLRWKVRTVVLSCVTGLVLLGCAMVTWVQVGYWRSNFRLWPHCLAVTSRNFTAEYNYGYALQNAGQIKEAILHLQNAVSLRPQHVDANLNLGRALAATGDLKGAVNYFAKAVEFDPTSSDAHGNYGAALFQTGDFTGAAAQCAESARLNPSDFRSLFYLARALGQENKFDEAIRNYAEALRLNPANPEANYYLGMEYLKHDMLTEAIASLTEAVRLNPNYTDARIQLDLTMAKASASRTPAK